MHEIFRHAVIIGSWVFLDLGVCAAAIIGFVLFTVAILFASHGFDRWPRQWAYLLLIVPGLLGAGAWVGILGAVFYAAMDTLIRIPW